MECAKFGFQNIMRNYMELRWFSIAWFEHLRHLEGDTGRRLCPPQVNERAQQVVNQSLKTDALYEMLEQDGWTDGLSRLSHAVLPGIHRAIW